MFVSMCVCERERMEARSHVYMCVRERERERENGSKDSFPLTAGQLCVLYIAVF